MNTSHDLCPEWIISQWFNTAEPLSSEQFRGEVLLLHFFQMLCPGCVSHALPQAQAVHQRFGGSGLRVVGIHSVFEHHDAMPPNALAAFIHEYRLSFPIGIDQQAEHGPIPITMQAYRLRGTPSLLLIDRNGRIRTHVFGRVDDLELGVALGNLLSESNSGAVENGNNKQASQNEVECDEVTCSRPITE